MAMRMVKNPGCWLAAGVFAALLVLWAHGRFETLFTGDSQHYISFSENSLIQSNTLKRFRTVGYPIFLKLARPLSPSFGAVPFLQFLAHVIAVVALFGGLRSVGASAGSSAFLSLSVLWYDSLWDVSWLLSDSLALSLAIASVAVLLVCVGRASRLWPRILLALVIFAAYQVRPAYLFLIVLIPLMALLLFPILASKPLSRSGGFGFVVSVTAASIVPYLCFCLLRLIVVGHFGLVSFAGPNLIGIAGLLLTPDVIPKLTPEVQPLARRILERRPPKTPWNSSHTGRAQSESETSYVFGTGIETIDWDAVTEQYNRIIWEVTMPEAWSLFEDYGQGAELNDLLRSLSLQVFAERPLAYGEWLLRGLQHAAIIGLCQRMTLVQLCLLSILLMAYGVFAWARPPPGRQAINAEAPTAGAESILIGVSLISVLFFFAKTALVVAVEVPINRYVRPAAVLLPMIPATLSFALISRIASLMRRSPDGMSRGHALMEDDSGLS